MELMGRHLLYCGTDLGQVCLELFLFHILPPCSVCASTCFSVEQHFDENMAKKKKKAVVAGAPGGIEA